MHWKPNKEIWWFLLSLLPVEYLQKSPQFQNIPIEKLRLNQLKCYPWIGTITQQRGPFEKGEPELSIGSKFSEHPHSNSLLSTWRISREKPPITEHFPKKFSFLNPIESFLCHWNCKVEGYKHLLVSEVMDPRQKHTKRMSDSLL
jgi:hypothetical protein